MKSITLSADESVIEAARARAGEDVILAKAGKPYARLVAVPSEPPRRMPGRLAGRVGDESFEPLSDQEPDAWEGR